MFRFFYMLSDGRGPYFMPIVFGEELRFQLTNYAGFQPNEWLIYDGSN